MGFPPPPPSVPVTSVFARTGAVVAGNADYLAVASGGLTGATAATRYVGGTASGAPASGTFAIGDYIIDRTGAVFICTTAGSPGTWTQAGATYTPPTTRGEYQGNNVSIGSGATGFLTWDTLATGSAVLDISTPNTPKIVTSGIYGISVTIGAASITVGDYATITLMLDSPGGVDVELTQRINSTAVNPNPPCCVSGTMFFTATHSLRIRVVNSDHLAAVNFQILDSIVQRIT